MVDEQKFKDLKSIENISERRVFSGIFGFHIEKTLMPMLVILHVSLGQMIFQLFSHAFEISD